MAALFNVCNTTIDTAIVIVNIIIIFVATKNQHHYYQHHHHHCEMGDLDRGAKFELGIHHHLQCKNVD